MTASIPRAPMVSVVMAVKNGGQIMREAIDSILNQTFTDFEFIIINDGSTDETEQIIQSYQDPRIKLFTQENLGIAKTANKGLRLAKGKYIARQDHDDVSLPSRLLEQVKFLENNPKCGLLGTCAEIWNEDGPTGRYHDHPSDPGILEIELLFNNPFVHSSLMYRREALNKVGFYDENPALSPLDDYHFISRFIHQYEVANLPKRLQIYREFKNSATSKSRDLRQREAFSSSLAYISSQNLGRYINRSAIECEVFGNILHLRGYTSLKTDDYIKVKKNLELVVNIISNKHPKINPLGILNIKLDDLQHKYLCKLRSDKDPLVSVVMAVKNGSKLIHEAIDSILNQTFQDFEFIIINDGSSDNTEQIIQSYQDQRIKLFSQENIGLAGSLNRGLSIAKGKYIARQDHDDVSLPSRLLEQVKFLENNPKCGLLGTCAEIWNEDGPTGRYHDHPSDPGILEFELLFNNPFVHSSWMFKRGIIDGIGYYTTDLTRQPPEDYEFVSRVSRKYDVANLQLRLVIYREIDQSLSSTLRVKTEKQNQEFIQKLVLISSENFQAVLHQELIKEKEINNLCALSHQYLKGISGPLKLHKMLNLVRMAAIKIQLKHEYKNHEIEEFAGQKYNNLSHQFYLQNTLSTFIDKLIFNFPSYFRLKTNRAAYLLKISYSYSRNWIFFRVISLGIRINRYVSNLKNFLSKK